MCWMCPNLVETTCPRWFIAFKDRAINAGSGMSGKGLETALMGGKKENG